MNSIRRHSVGAIDGQIIAEKQHLAPAPAAAADISPAFPRPGPRTDNTPRPGRDDWSTIHASANPMLHRYRNLSCPNYIGEPELLSTY